VINKQVPSEKEDTTRNNNDSNNSNLVRQQIKEWNVENVCEWFQDFGLDKYNVDIKDQKLNGETLAEILDNNEVEDLKESLKMTDDNIVTLKSMFLDKLCGKVTINYRAWSKERVIRWITEIGLQEYSPKFDKERITGEVLDEMTEDEMLQLIETLGHRWKFRRELKKLKHSVSLQSESQDKLTWTVQDVEEWLKQIGLGEYCTKFAEQKVDGECLQELILGNEQQKLLKELLGVTPLGDRKKIPREFSNIPKDKYKK